jgi:hypothetical protein
MKKSMTLNGLAMAIEMKMKTSKFLIPTKRKAHRKRRHQIQMRKGRLKGSPPFLHLDQ